MADGRMATSRRGALSLLVLTVSLVAALLVAGCGGPSVQELVRQDVQAQLDTLKTGAADAMVQSMEQAAGGDLTQLGVSAKDLANAYLKGFDYKVDGVDVDEEKGTATAHVTLSCKSVGGISSAFSTAYQEQVKGFSGAPTQSDLLKLAGSVMKDAVSQAEPAEKQVDLTYKKNDAGEWALDTEAANKAIADAMQ